MGETGDKGAVSLYLAVSLFGRGRHGRGQVVTFNYWRGTVTGSQMPRPDPISCPRHFAWGHSALIASTVRSTRTWPPSGPTRLLWITAP